MTLRDRAATTALAAAGAGSAAAAWTVWSLRGPAGGRLAADPRGLAIVLAAALLAAVVAHFLPARARSALALACVPASFVGLRSLERVDLVSRPVALGIVAAALLFAVALAGMGLVRRWGPPRPWHAALALLGCGFGVYGAMVAPGVVADADARIPVRQIAFGDGWRSGRHFANGVIHRRSVTLTERTVLFVRVGYGPLPAGGDSQLSIELRQGRSTWRTELLLVDAEAAGDPVDTHVGFVAKSFAVTGLGAGEAMLDVALTGAAPQSCIHELSVHDASLIAISRIVSPHAASWGRLADPDMAPGHEPVVVPAPGEVALVWPEPGAGKWQIQVGIPVPLWIAPVTVDLELQGAGQTQRREIVLDHPSWQWSTVTFEVGDELRPYALRVRTATDAAGPAAIALTRPRRVSLVAPKSVVIVSLDTVRADRIGAYGSPRPTTPNLDALAARGVLFERASSTAPWTLPAHASLFTSRAPSDVLDLPFGFDEPRAFTPPEPVLAEVFARAGYETAAMSGGGYVSEVLGFSRGFDRYQEAGQLGHDPERQLRGVERWLATRTPGPFLLFFHTFRAHKPYRGDEFVDDLPAAATEAERALASYDSGLLETDRALGDLLALLDRFGRRDDTLIVVLSDHGEAFGEHVPETSGYGHTNSLYEELLRVPLVMAGPGLPQGLRITDTVSLLDVAPTVLRYVGVTPPAGFEGRSLTPLWQGQTMQPEPLVVEQFAHEGVDRRGVRLGSLKVIATAAAGQPTTVAVYDLDRDPEEREPLPVTACEVAESLSEAAIARFARVPNAAAEVSLSALEEQLRALGYIN